jgi:hypothetical protein
MMEEKKHTQNEEHLIRGMMQGAKLKHPII